MKHHEKLFTFQGVMISMFAVYALRRKEDTTCFYFEVSNCNEQTDLNVQLL